MSAVLVNPSSGEHRVVPTGFSWTTLFFGPFPALFRGDVLWAALIAVSAFLLFPLLIWPFVYNGIHLKRLLAKGFLPGSNLGGRNDGQSIQHHVNVHVGNVAGHDPNGSYRSDVRETELLTVDKKPQLPRPDTSA